MVRVNKGRMRYVGSDFNSAVEVLQDRLAQVTGKRPTCRVVTDSIGGFILDHNLHEEMVERARKKQEEMRKKRERLLRMAREKPRRIF